MPSIILSDNGVSSGSAGLKSTAASDGVLALQTTTAGGTATTAVTIDTSQNLGLGVTPSAWYTASASPKALQVNYASIYGDTNVNASFASNWYLNSAGSQKYIASGYATRYLQTSGQHRWYYAASGSADADITFTQAMTLDASGNLGIGTTSPTSRLHVAGDAPTIKLQNTASSDTPYIQGGTSGAGGDGYLYLSGGTSRGVKLAYNAGTVGATLDASGNLLVGTTNATSSSGIGVKLLPTGSVYVVNSNQDGFDFYSTSAGAYRFYVTAGGTIYATSTTISAISDERLKENIRDIDTGINSVMALKPRRFDWKEGKGQNKKDVAGFIAQEFEEVFPECVGTTKAGEDGIEYKNINHETLIPTLVKAIQEQQAIIEQLKARLDAANL